MRNIKLTLAYDGTDLHGWQIQPEQPTVQGLLTDAIERLTQERPVVNGAGRTDAGVHAWGQVANFQTNSGMQAGDFLRALNALLPPVIRVRAAQEVGEEFHARHLAQAKTYRYRICRDAVLPPFSRRYVLHDPFPLDFAAMAEAARHFEGSHDFTSFAASTGSEEEDEKRTTVRTVYDSELLRGGDLPDGTGGMATEEWVYVVHGKSFLRHMVRKIVGTLLEVGRGRIAAADIPGLLERRDRSCSGPTAPPQGLCLMEVEYPEAPAAQGGPPEDAYPESQ
jgi:tRNA pseudouridine38-40 synthase